MIRALFLLAIASFALAIVFVASADSPHFKRGSPSFADVQTGATCTAADEGRIDATASISGLGNADVLISVDVTPGDVGTCVTGTVFSCTNPGGESKVPGQNPATISGSLAIPKEDIKNGNLTRTVSTLTTVPGAPGCPNKGWTQGVDALAASSVTLTIKQGGVTVLNPTCVPPDAPSNNGQTWTC